MFRNTRYDNSQRTTEKILLGLWIAVALTTVVATSAFAQTAGSETPLSPPSYSKSHGTFCSGDLLLDQEPNLVSSLWSESTCDGCSSGSQVLADDFALQRETLITEIVVWGWYFPNNTPPPIEHWTVAFHPDVDPAVPGESLGEQIVASSTRVATGRSATVLEVDVDEYRWLLRLETPVRLPGGIHWVQVFHDSPVLAADTSIGFGDVDPSRGFPGAASSFSAPGEDWQKEESDLALQVCGVDARWDGLVVPTFEVDESAPGKRTLIAARNTSDSPIDLVVSYYGTDIEAGPLRQDIFPLGPNRTLTRDVAANTAGLDPDFDGLATGFVVLSEATGGAANLTGDVARVDSANDFAAGERMLAFDEFCQRQEIRLIDFGSGSIFNVVLRDPPAAGQPGFRVDIFDEAGTLVASADVAHDGSHTRKLASGELTDLSFGTVVFDFSASGSGAVTGSYSAFGRFSTEIRGICRK